jgi:hypothetical protein
MNVIAIIISLALLIFAKGILAKFLGLGGLIFIIKEIVTGEYKKHIN